MGGARLRLDFDDLERAPIKVRLTEAEVESPLRPRRRLRHASRADGRWDENEDRRLAERHEEGETVVRLAQLHGREPNAIRSRLRKLGLSS
jgi:hypothetical protein